MKQLFLIAGLLLSLHYTVLAQKNNTPAGGNPILTLVNNDTLYDFGAIPTGDQADNLFEIKNTGDAPLIISRVSCNAADIACRWPHGAIKPGKTGAITIVYTANGTTGSFLHDVVINSNSQSAANSVIHIKGAIVPVNSMPASKPAKQPHGHGGHAKFSN